MPGLPSGADTRRSRSAQLQLNFLGPFEVTLDGQPVSGFAADKVRALLAYLAVEGTRRDERSGQPHRREALAGLLWPDYPDSDALISLRQAIHRLRQALGEGANVNLPPLLLVTSQTLQLDTDTYRLDVDEFSELVEACRTHRHRKLEYCTTCHGRFLRAAEIYRGDLLAGFFLEDSQAFDEWLVLKREALRRQALEVFESLATYHEKRAEHSEALRYVYRQLEMEPWREEAHRQAMKLLAVQGQRSAAIAQYETCRRVLLQEFALEPEAQTTALFEVIRDQGGKQPLIPDPRPVIPESNLPQPLNPFIGREEELARINELLDSPDYRLITLVGLGGVGKTRLAIQAAAEQVNTFDDGVRYIPLAAVSGPELLASSIAQAVGLRFGGSLPPEAQLLEYLRDKEMLLVLDNFEHLLGGGARDDATPVETGESGTELLISILKNAPKVTTLVTSREHLDLQAEYLVDVLGLPYPQTDQSAVSSQQYAVLPAAQYGAVRLFVERAQRVQAGFVLSAENAQGVLDICRLVEGLPLGIVLAAAWVRHFPPARIAESIRGNLDFLKSSSRDASAQHSSLRAVFNHSWNLLTEGEQQILRRLSVFRGGWDEDAAEKVAGAAIFSLLSLVDKSLVRREGEGRFNLHEVVRQYAAEQLQAVPGEQEEAQAAHAARFLELAERAHGYLSGPDTETWLAILDQEHDNFRAALRWTRGLGAGGWGLGSQADPQPPHLGLRMAAVLWPFWFLRGYSREGRELLEGALSDAPADEASKATRARALNGAGTLAWRLGDYAAARSFYEEGLAINRELGDERGISQSLHNLGLVVYSQGDYGAARAINEEVLALHRELGDKDRIARSLANLAMVARDQGDNAAARSIYEESLALSRELGDKRSVCAALSGLGEIARFQGDYASARSLFEESLAIRRELGEEGGIALTLNSLGSVAHSQGDYATALSLYEQALATRRKLGDKSGIAASLCNLGSWAYSQGDYVTAGARYRESLVLQRELREKLGTIRCLVGLGGVAVGSRQSAVGGEAPEPILPTAAVPPLLLLPTAYVGAKLLGAAEALLESIGAVMDPAEGMIYEQGVASARAGLGEEEFEKAIQEGRAMGVEQAIESALQVANHE